MPAAGISIRSFERLHSALRDRPVQEGDEGLLLVLFVLWTVTDGDALMGSSRVPIVVCVCNWKHTEDMGSESQP